MLYAEFFCCCFALSYIVLSRIIDTDKVMVLSKGELLQFDTPANLLRDEEGYFVRTAVHSTYCLW